IDTYGERYDPWFKPDWNPELLLGQDYLGALAAIRIDRIAADLDEAVLPGALLGWAVKLRATAGLEQRHVGHVREVLCHVRDSFPVAEPSVDTKLLVAMLRDVLARTGAAGIVEQRPGAGVRVRYPLAVPVPRVSILVPTRNGHALVRQCVE